MLTFTLLLAGHLKPVLKRNESIDFRSLPLEHYDNDTTFINHDLIKYDAKEKTLWRWINLVYT
jgi:hypothetical protein